MGVITVSNALGHTNPHITFTVYVRAIAKTWHSAGKSLARPTVQSGNKMKTSQPDSASVA